VCRRVGAQDEPAGARRPGGRSARVRQAVFTAVLDELVENGYGALTFDRVAARAGVHRATLYRRWPGREQLVAEALLAQAGRDIPLPDTGTLRGDLRALAHAVVTNITSPLGEGLLRTLVSEAVRVPDISVAGRAFWGQRFGLATEIVRRGIRRGEVRSDVDPQLMLELLVAPLFLRLLVTAEPVTTAYVDEVLDVLLPLIARTPDGRQQ
jgi:AcrR family transcriptional regulator